MSRYRTWGLVVGLLVGLPWFSAPLADAGPLRELLLARHGLGAARQDRAAAPMFLPAGVTVMRDVAYGPDPAQRFDVYRPAHAQNAPVIFMVHGGAWAMGDKGSAAVVANKVGRWVPEGFILVSTNYRLLPQAAPLDQARDVAKALATAQAMAAGWGGDPARFIVMGHSAGAHLVSLLASDPALSSGLIQTPVLGTIALDSAAYDVPAIMQARHFPFYDRAFGSDPRYWKAASPLYALTGPARPLLAVCSTRRRHSCSQASRFVARATTLGTRASVLEEDLSHRQIDLQLGDGSAYTTTVESFMASLDPGVAGLLKSGTHP